MQRVVITGGAGFIGSHLCNKLLAVGYSVICIDNFITGKKKNIEPLLQNSAFSLIEFDISRNISEVSDKIKNVDFIFHLASPASPNKNSKQSYISYPIETLLVNSIGTYYLLEFARIHNAQFLFASTSEVYGDPNTSPQPESYFGNVNPVGVRSVYDEAKRYGEAMTMAFVRKYDADARIIRIFNTYGPQMQKDDGRVVSNFINQALEKKPLTVYGDGNQTRSFCYISDMVDGIQKAMFTPNTKGEVINLGNPDERTVLETAHLIQELTGTTSQIELEPLPEDDPHMRQPDIAKAQHLLHFQPQVQLKEGLLATIEYFKNS